MNKEQELMQLTNRYRELHARVAADNKEMDAINIRAREIVEEIMRGGDDRLPVESASFLLSLLDGVDIPDGIDHGEWDTREFDLANGWKVSIYYDCGDLDYINHFISPSGKIVDFWYWPESDDRAKLINWCGSN